MQLHTRVMGSGPRIVFVHGSLTTSEQSWEKQEPLAERPKLVVSGGHSGDLERCSDSIAEHLGPNVQRLVMTGRGHVVARLGDPFNQMLEKFLVSADGA